MDDEFKLILPERPTEEDLLLCQDQIDEINFYFDNDPSKVTYAALAPLVQNLVQVSAQLLRRAKLVKSRFLDTPSKIDLDYVLLGTTVSQIEELHERVLAYKRLLNRAKTAPPGEKSELLLLSIYMPLFHGSGFDDPEDPNSPWVQSLSVWCEPMRLAVALEREVGFHIPSWKVPKKKDEGVNLGYVALGGLAIFGGVKLLQYWGRRR